MSLLIIEIKSSLCIVAIYINEVIFFLLCIHLLNGTLQMVVAFYKKIMLFLFFYWIQIWL